MAIQVIEPTVPPPSILSSAGNPQITRIVLPGSFARGLQEVTPGFFSEAIATPAQGLAAPSIEEVPDDSVSSCFDSNGTAYCRTPITYCVDGEERQIYVLASEI
jgi:hypothetical protein